MLLSAVVVAVLIKTSGTWTRGRLTVHADLSLSYVNSHLHSNETRSLHRILNMEKICIHCSEDEHQAFLQPGIKLTARTYMHPPTHPPTTIGSARMPPNTPNTTAPPPPPLPPPPPPHRYILHDNDDAASPPLPSPHAAYHCNVFTGGPPAGACATVGGIAAAEEYSGKDWMGAYSGLRFGPTTTTGEGDKAKAKANAKELCSVRYYPDIDAYIFARTYRNSSEEPAWPSLGCTSTAAPPSYSALEWYASYMLDGNVVHSPWETPTSQSFKEIGEENAEENAKEEEGDGAKVSDGPIFLYPTPSLPASAQPPLGRGAKMQLPPADAPTSTLAISALDYTSVNGPNFQAKPGKGWSKESKTEAPSVSQYWYGVSMTSTRGNFGSASPCRLCWLCRVCRVCWVCRVCHYGGVPLYVCVTVSLAMLFFF